MILRTVCAFLILLLSSAARAATVSAPSSDTSSVSASAGIVDVMPLSVGNQWTYRYYSRTWSYDPVTIIDSGLAVYEIIAFDRQPDSVLWTFVEHRYIKRCSIDFFYETHCSFIADSSTFQLIELRSGLHRLYRQESEDVIWDSVFPWSYEFVESTSVHRYAAVDSAGTAMIRPQHADSFYSRNFEHAFVQGGGLTRSVCETSPFIVGVEYNSDHVLVSSVISDVQEGVGRGQPTDFTLSQNYPNPFNSSTTIAFHLAAVSHTRLLVWDILGRVVATLVDETLPPGPHRVTWEAPQLSSGIYCFRLDAGGAGIAKRALLLR